MINFIDLHLFPFRRDFFYLLDYVTHRSEKLGFQKKKKKKMILPDTTVKLFIFGLIRNHQENIYFETSLSFGKLRKNCGVYIFSFFFAIADLKNLS